MKTTMPSIRKFSTVILLALLLFSCQSDSVSYRTEPVTRGDIKATVTASGTVNAVTTVLVGTQVSGTVKNIYVDFNSTVRKGQLIAQIDPSTFEAQVQQAQANLISAQANLDKAKAALVDAKRTFERNKELFTKNLIPRSDLDTSETTNQSAKAQVNLTRAQERQAEASLAIAKQNLEYTRIVSPVDGVVISRSVDVGQTVAASFQTPTLFTIAQDLTKMQIDTNVAESDIGSVQVDQNVEFTVDAYPDRTFTGKVWQIRKAPITVQNVVTYDVVVKVDNEDFKLMPGMTANVSIIIETRDNVLRVTNASLRFRPQEGPENGKGQKGPAVWVLEGKKLKRVAMTPGISDGVYTEVVKGDLQEKQRLIVDTAKKGGGRSRSGPRMF